MTEPRRARVYRAIFRQNNGDGPYTCVFCLEETPGWPRVTVHHADLDYTNNDPPNLKPCHHRCHDIYHRSLETVSDETRARIGASVRAHLVDHPRGPLSEDHRGKISAYQRGRPKSPETRAKMAEARRRYWERKRSGN